MLERLPSIFIPIVVVLAISLSMHRKSYDAITGTAYQYMDLFAPTRLEGGFEAVTDAESMKVNDIGKPLNVVIMYADDMRHNSIGTYRKAVSEFVIFFTHQNCIRIPIYFTGVAGDLPVETPFIDWLARNKAIRFTHNCVTSSICWISRATLHSGQYFSRHKAEEPASEDWYKNFHEAFPALLRNAGYFVAHIGKWHTWNSHKINRKFARMDTGCLWRMFSLCI